MSSIQVEDHVRAVLEANAAARGLSISNYLAMLAGGDSTTAEPAHNRSLAESLGPIIAEARSLRLQPRTPNDVTKSTFDAAMVEKYRKQGFSL